MALNPLMFQPTVDEIQIDDPLEFLSDRAIEGGPCTVRITDIGPNQVEVVTGNGEHITIDRDLIETDGTGRWFVE